MLQSLVDQIDEVRKVPSAGENLPGIEMGESDRPEDAWGITILSRDFMILRVPAHELSPAERDEIERVRAERDEVMGSWAQFGGVWVDEQGGKRWIGVDPEPRSQ